MLALKTDATLRLHKRALAPTMSSTFLTIASARFSEHMVNFVALWQARLKLAADSDGAREMFWDAEGDLHSLTTVRAAISLQSACTLPNYHRSRSNQDSISHITFGESFEQLSADKLAVERQTSPGTRANEISSSGHASQGRHPIADHMEVLFGVGRARFPSGWDAQVTDVSVVSVIRLRPVSLWRHAPSVPTPPSAAPSVL
jgi:hypothetical protein